MGDNENNDWTWNSANGINLKRFAVLKSCTWRKAYGYLWRLYDYRTAWWDVNDWGFMKCNRSSPNEPRIFFYFLRWCKALESSTVSAICFVAFYFYIEAIWIRSCSMHSTGCVIFSQSQICCVFFYFIPLSTTALGGTVFPVDHSAVRFT